MKIGRYFTESRLGGIPIRSWENVCSSLEGYTSSIGTSSQPNAIAPILSEAWGMLKRESSWVHIPKREVEEVDPNQRIFEIVKGPDDMFAVSVLTRNHKFDDGFTRYAAERGISNGERGLKYKIIEFAVEANPENGRVEFDFNAFASISNEIWSEAHLTGAEIMCSMIHGGKISGLLGHFSFHPQIFHLNKHGDSAAKLYMKSFSWNPLGRIPAFGDALTRTPAQLKVPTRSYSPLAVAPPWGHMEISLAHKAAPFPIVDRKEVSWALSSMKAIIKALEQLGATELTD